MSILDQLAETRIREAAEQGALDDLAGAGRPLELEDLSLVPESLRAGYLLLKNAGCLPPEIEASRRAGGVNDLLQGVEREGEGGAASRGRRRLRLLLSRLKSSDRACPLWAREAYGDRLESRLGAGRHEPGRSGPAKAARVRGPART
ncbi:MAG TPA: DnaJ family domain-containing protein [Gammaproteobacteria bacterium]|nr:DnaJ family domain-containing protein [Gammaproteobacteria bacterium]